LPLLLAWTPCEASDLMSGNASKQQDYAQRIFWLHFPKCGTSFEISVAPYLRSTDRKRELHQSLGRSSSVGEVAAMFRSPEERLLSAHHWMSVRPQCCRAEWGWPSRVSDEAFARIAIGEPPTASFARFTGCQTSMILGSGCMSATKHSAEAVSRAVSLVSKFRFVGLVSEWRLSMCLFNYLMGGQRFVLEEQLVDVRPAFDGPSSALALHNYTAMLPRMPVDEADHVTYAFASLRFRRDLEHHGIREGACPLRSGVSALGVVREAAETQEHYAGRLMHAVTSGHRSSYHGLGIGDTWEPAAPAAPCTRANGCCERHPRACLTASSQPAAAQHDPV